MRVSLFALPWQNTMDGVVFKNKNLFFHISESSEVHDQGSVGNGNGCLVRAALYLQDGSSMLCPLERRGMVSSQELVNSNGTLESLYPILAYHGS